MDPMSYRELQEFLTGLQTGLSREIIVVHRRILFGSAPQRWG